MHDKLERLSGNPHVHRTKGTPFDHCCHSTAGMKRMEDQVEEKVEKLAGRR